MAHFLSNHRIRTICLSSILLTFLFTVVTPPPCYAQVGLNDVAFGVRIERIIEKVWKYIDKKDSNKLLDAMIEMKQEVEGYTGQKIDLDKQIDQVEKEMKQRGTKVDKKDMKALRKKLKDKERKANHRSLCMAQYMEDAPDVTFQEYESLHRETKKHQDKEDEEEKEIVLPLRFVIGVTASLCGLFLCFVPIPICKSAGAELIKSGIALAIEGYVNRQEDDRYKQDN